MIDILISISILFLLPPPFLPLNQFSNDGSGRFFWGKKNEVLFGFLVNGGRSEQLSSSQRAGTWSLWRRFPGLQLQGWSWRGRVWWGWGVGGGARVGGQPCWALGKVPCLGSFLVVRKIQPAPLRLRPGRLRGWWRRRRWWAAAGFLVHQAV